MNVKVFATIVEDEALQQIETLSKRKAFEAQKIRIMPDCHSGKGCVIGFTSTIGDYVIPSVVGVDISCGMLTVELGKVNIDYDRFDKVIREYVPSGKNVHETGKCNTEFLQELKCFEHLKNINRIYRSIGTLGGGNHFIEIDKDSEDRKYLIIHTGSRNLGKQVADYYQNLASEIQVARIELEKFYKGICSVEVNKELAYLIGNNKNDYLHDMKICQEYASLNRYRIAELILSNYGTSYGEVFETLHNYIDLEKMIVRKGAIDASKGKKLLIPINMRDGCILGVGKGNEDWNCSAPHGAGRLMSRTKAKSSFTLEQYKQSMSGIYTTSISEDTLDELPMAYKPIESITSMIKDTVDIIDIIKPVYNYKASE